MPLEILIETEELIAINKPHGLLVHRSRIAKDATEFALQLLRDQIGQRVYLAHRLDRKTSGVLLFGKSKQVEAELQQLFSQRKINKQYLAIVRGYLKESDCIDYALEHEGKVKEAITHFSSLDTFELPFQTSRYPTSRYSYISLKPETGRFHQIRKHMAHIFHPILGDRPHGCNKQNKLWKEQYGLTEMMLHAEVLEFRYREKDYCIKAGLSNSFLETLEILNSQQL